MSTKTRNPIRTNVPKAAAPKASAPPSKQKDDQKPATLAKGGVVPTAEPPVKKELPASEAVNGDVKQEETVVIDVPIEEIVILPDPHRTAGESEKDELDSITTLAHSLQDLGMMHPVVLNARKDGGYELVAGRKRLKAASMLRWETVPASIRNYDEFKTKMAVITENLIRTAYSPAQFDKAMAEYGGMYETLHPETKAHVAGGKGRAKQASGKVTAQPKKKSFVQTVAAKTGLKPSTVYKARKRGKTFTDDDYAVFESKGVKVAEQNKIAAITDPKKRQEVVKKIHGGATAKAAYDDVMLPPGAKTEQVNGAAGSTESDEQWLAKCPVRKHVVKGLFDAQALFFRRMLDAKMKVERLFNQARKEFKGLVGGKHGYPAAVSRFIKIKHPTQWTVCGTCSGKGVIAHKGAADTPCTDCDGGGFKID